MVSVPVEFAIVFLDFREKIVQLKLVFWINITTHQINYAHLPVLQELIKTFIRELVYLVQALVSNV